MNRLEDPPTLVDLMTRVAVNCPTKWRDIGIHLGLGSEDLDAIHDRHRGDHHRCFEYVFSAWENKKKVPYTWSTIIKALESPLVERKRLADEIKSALQQI